MSQTVYLVRLRAVFRLCEIYDVRVDRIPPEAIFASRTAAEHYTQTQLPLSHNPFARTNESFFVDEGRINFDPYTSEEATSRHYDPSVFLERLAQAGIEPPDDWDYEPKSWALWWEVATLEMSPEQKAKLRQDLELPDWSENLFERALVSLYDDIALSYMVPLDMLEECATRWGLTPPYIVAPHSLHSERATSLVHWWDQNAPKMTDEQKADLWRLLDPQPWEIVEVELEGSIG